MPHPTPCIAVLATIRRRSQRGRLPGRVPVHRRVGRGSDRWGTAGPGSTLAVQQQVRGAHSFEPVILVVILGRFNVRHDPVHRQDLSSSLPDDCWWAGYLNEFSKLLDSQRRARDNCFFFLHVNGDRVREPVALRQRRAINTVEYRDHDQQSIT